MDLKLQHAVHCAGVDASGDADGGNGSHDTRKWAVPTSGRRAEEFWCVGRSSSSSGGGSAANCKYGGVIIGEAATAAGSNASVAAGEACPTAADASNAAAAAMAMSAIAADAQQLSVESSRSVPAPFLTKTYQLVDDASSDHIVSWGDDGTTFVVWRPPEFARDLLPNYFKHNNFSSFVRQLNTYGFRKIVPDRWEFANDFFRKGERHLLCEIHRRKASAAGQGGRCSPTSGSSADDSAMAASCSYSLWDLPSPVSTNSANQALVQMMHHPAVAVGMLAHHPAAAAQSIYAASGGGAATAPYVHGEHSSVSQYSMYDENDRLRRDNAVLLAELLHMRKVYREVLLYVQHLSGGATAVYYPRPPNNDSNDTASAMPPLAAIACESPAAAPAVSATAIMPAPAADIPTINASKYALSSGASHRTIDGDVRLSDVTSHYGAAVSAAAVADYVDSVVDRNRNATRTSSAATIAGVTEYPESAHPFSSYNYAPLSMNGRLSHGTDGGRSDYHLEPPQAVPPPSPSGNHMPMPISSVSHSGRAIFGSSSDGIGGASSDEADRKKGHEKAIRKYNDGRNSNHLPSVGGGAAASTAEASDDGETIPPAPRLFGVALQSGSKKRHHAETEADRINNNSTSKEDADRRPASREDRGAAASDADNNSSASNISSSFASPFPLISGCEKSRCSCISNDIIMNGTGAPPPDYDLKLQPGNNADLNPQLITSSSDNGSASAAATNNNHRRKSAAPWITFGFTAFRDEQVYN